MSFSIILRGSSGFFFFVSSMTTETLRAPAMVAKQVVADVLKPLNRTSSANVRAKSTLHSVRGGRREHYGTLDQIFQECKEAR